MKISRLRKIIREALEDKVKECPASTQDVGLNTANRDRAIQADFIKYGPLNVEEPGDYWEQIAKRWNTSGLLFIQDGTSELPFINNLNPGKVESIKSRIFFSP